jgi:putative transposase
LKQGKVWKNSAGNLWRKKYGGLDKPLLKKLKELDKENARLKKIVAQQALDIDSLKDLLGKDW